MTITLPNPFIDSLSAGRLPPTGQLTVHVDHAAVLSIREASGKRPVPSMSPEPCKPAPVSAASTGRQECETMGVTAGETATNSRDDVSTSNDFFPYRFGRKAAPSPIPSAEVTAELEAGIADIVASLAASKSAPLFLRDPSPEYLAASSNHIALRSFASNSTFNFPSSVKA